MQKWNKKIENLKMRWFYRLYQTSQKNIKFAMLKCYWKTLENFIF